MHVPIPVPLPIPILNVVTHSHCCASIKSAF